MLNLQIKIMYMKPVEERFGGKELLSRMEVMDDCCIVIIVAVVLIAVVHFLFVFCVGSIR